MDCSGREQAQRSLSTLVHATCRITSAQDALLLSSSQGIAPLLNNPSFVPAAVWCWPLFGGPEQLSADPPPMPAGMVPEVTMADFMRYLRVIGDKHNRFSQLRQESMNDQRRKISVTDITPGMQHATLAQANH